MLMVKISMRLWSNFLRPSQECTDEGCATLIINWLGRKEVDYMSLMDLTDDSKKLQNCSRCSMPYLGLKVIT